MHDDIDNGVDTRPEAQLLFKTIKSKMEALGLLQKVCEEEWGGEEGVYRYYHHSFKVYRLQDLTMQIVGAIRGLHPEPSSLLNPMFESIISEGTGKEWEHSHNLKWSLHTRPIVEAYLHAKWMLDMVIKYGKELEAPPQLLPAGWATVLYLFNLR